MITIMRDKLNVLKNLLRACSFTAERNKSNFVCEYSHWWTWSVLSIADPIAIEGGGHRVGHNSDFRDNEAIRRKKSIFD